MSELPAPHTWKAPAHDPLCSHDTHPYPATCETCILIARVRADERERVMAVARVNSNLAADLRAKVKVLPHSRWVGTAWILRADVLALLDDPQP
jgi:hypothetical protein